MTKSKEQPKKQNSVARRQAELEEHYKDLCEEGYEYEDILEELNINRHTLTKCALATNRLPSYPEYEQNQLCQLLYEQTMSKKHAIKAREQKALDEAKKARRTYEPDLFLN